MSCIYICVVSVSKEITVPKFSEQKSKEQGRSTDLMGEILDTHTHRHKVENSKNKYFAKLESPKNAKVRQLYANKTYQILIVWY